MTAIIHNYKRNYNYCMPNYQLPFLKYPVSSVVKGIFSKSWLSLSLSENFMILWKC